MFDRALGYHVTALPILAPIDQNKNLRMAKRPIVCSGSSGRRENLNHRALARAQDKIEFIQVRHEEMAAFMACAHAKFTGEVVDLPQNARETINDRFVEGTASKPERHCAPHLAPRK